jgi:hypothetical protein
MDTQAIQLCDFSIITCPVITHASDPGHSLITYFSTTHISIILVSYLVFVFQIDACQQVSLPKICAHFISLHKPHVHPIDRKVIFKVSTGGIAAKLCTFYTSPTPRSNSFYNRRKIPLHALNRRKCGWTQERSGLGIKEISRK